MKLAAVGFGHWGKNIVKTLDEMGALGCVVETEPSLREKCIASYPDVAVHSHLSDALSSDVVGVCLATPVVTHVALAEQVLAAGKDVFIEKPLALTIAEAEPLVKMGEELGRVVMVGHLLLYQPAVQWIAEAIRDGAIGDLFSIHQYRLNFGKARSHENALWSLGVHDVAVLLHLVGSAPISVFATGQAALQPTIADDVHVHFRFNQGVQAHLHNSWLWPEQRRGMTVIGNKGMLVYDEKSQTITLHQKRLHPDLSQTDEGEKIAFTGDNKPLNNELQHFIDCIATRQTPRSSGRSALDVLDVLEKAQACL